jgi:uncharacterized protein (DUF1330 family)
MAAYLIADLEATGTDPAAIADYRRDVPAIVAAFGGRYLARGAAELLEGEKHPHHMAFLEFPDMAQLKAFYHAPEYRALVAVRQRGSRANIIAIEGL